MKHIELIRDHSFITTLTKQIEQNIPLSPWDLFQLNFQAEKTTIVSDTTSLNALKHLPHITFMPHQISTANKVIQQMNGRAILADEVGLGKTIEAGLILKEYLVRRLVKKVLILVPASLINQWVKELHEKFYIQAVPYRKNFSWQTIDIVIASLDTAKRPPHREQILSENYDFVIIDEAHKLKNEKTINYQFVKSIKKTYCLLLTATPLQNSLIEVFNLVSILKPGLLGNLDTFKKTFGHKRHELMNNEYLKQLVQQVMVRNTRKKMISTDVKRHINTVDLNFSEEEQQFYQMIQQNTAELPKLITTTLQREFCSSREACFMTLQNLQNKYNEPNSSIEHLVDTVKQLPHHKKAERVVQLIKEIGDQKVIIFTEYRATQYYLEHYLTMHNISSVPFRGGFKQSKKDWMRQLFEHQAQVMIATEAGGEGINLQFCHHLINYDLPWNPLRLEQRIGRIHRIGQSDDVNIYNLVIKQTIEEHIVNLLYEKLNLFERVVGKLDKILDTLQIADIEEEIKNIFAHSLSDGEIKIKLDNLTKIIDEVNVNHENEEMI